MDISIIVPTHNRCESLRKCLDALLSQDYPRDKFEILVVDDGSTDATKDMVRELSQVHASLRFFSQPRKGPAAARNLGIREAVAGIIGFTDDDCVLSRDWASKMVQAHQQDDVAAVGGLTRVAPRNIKARVSQFLSDGAIEADINGKRAVVFFPTCNVSIKKSRLSGDGFDELFSLPAGEDLDFFWRLYKRGHALSYRRDIEVFHDCHPGLFSFVRQAYRYGRGNFLVQYLHRDQPLLKELKTGRVASFVAATLINVLKIPRFAFLCGRRLIGAKKEFSVTEKCKIYGYLALHKAMYVVGNIVEYRHLKRPGKKARRDAAPPEFIILDITHHCNLKCQMCEIRNDGTQYELSTTDVQGLILQAKEWGVGEFVLSGGEALLRPDILSLLDFCEKNKYRIGVLTNGVALDEKFMKKISPYLVSGVLSLSISLDALSPGIHDDIRGVEGCFVKTARSLKNLSELKKTHPRINFNAISIVLNENLEELLPLADFLKSLNVNSIQFQPLLANNLIMKERSRGVRYWIQAPRWPVLDRVIDSLVAFKRKNSHLVRNSEDNLLLMKKYFRGSLASGEVTCSYAAKTMLIAPSGDVTTCFDCYGNVKEKNLKDLHGSRAAERARARVKDCPSPCLLPCFCDS